MFTDLPFLFMQARRSFSISLDVLLLLIPTIITIMILTHDYSASYKHIVPFCPDSSDKEGLFRTLHEFLEAYTNSYLHANVAERYLLLRKTLVGDLCFSWDSVLANIPKAERTNHNFSNHLRSFLRMFLLVNAWTLQKIFMHNATNPFPWIVTRPWNASASSTFSAFTSQARVES
jgi:hypothetical protein